MIIPIGYATAGLIIDPTPGGAATDGIGGFTSIDGAYDVATFYNGTTPMAAVTSLVDGAVTIVNLEDPLNPKQLTVMTALDNQGTDGGELDAIKHPKDIEVWLNSTQNEYYAAVVGHIDDGVQILDLRDPTSDVNRTLWNATESVGVYIDAAESRFTDSGTTLDGAFDIAIFDNATTTTGKYVIVASVVGDAIQIFNARDTGDVGGHFQVAGNLTNAYQTDSGGTGAPTPDARGGTDGLTVLDGAAGVDTFTGTDGFTYGIATASVEDGIQIFSLRDPYNPIPYANATTANAGFELLDGAFDVATFTSGDSPYAIVTAQVSDAVTIIKLAGMTTACNDSSCLEVTDRMSDNVNLNLDGANKVKVVSVLERNYAVVTANATTGAGVQILDIHNPKNIQPVANLIESGGTGAEAYTEIEDADGVDTFTLGEHTYAIVANYDGDGIQVIKLTGEAAGGSNDNRVCGISKDCDAPTINKHGTTETTDGFSINGINLESSDRFNVNDTIEAKVGKLVTIKARIYDGSGTDAITKSNIYFDMPNTPEWSTASASILYDHLRDEVTIADTNDIFDATVSTSVGSIDGKEVLDVSFKIMFTSEMDTSHIAIQSVDNSRNYQLIYFKDALKIVDQSTGPTQTSGDETIGDEVTQTTTASVPAWVKNTAGWWAAGQISEGEFVSGVEFLIKQQIIDTPVQTSTSEGTGSSVPAWVKNTAGWWADGQISEGEFVSAIEHLVKTGTIIVI